MFIGKTVIEVNIVNGMGEVIVSGDDINMVDLSKILAPLQVKVFKTKRELNKEFKTLEKNYGERKWRRARAKAQAPSK